EVMQINVDSRQFTSILANMSFSVYNFTSSSWFLIDNDKYTSETLVEYDVIDFEGIGGLFDSSGNMRFKYYGFNSSEFNLKIDQLNITIYFKTVLEYEITLKLLGTWKYRFKIDVGLGGESIQSWVYFNVVIQQPNFEGISESKYTTKWVLTSVETTGYTVVSYSDDITPSSSWDLSGVSQRDFYKHPSVVDNYLLDNYTAQGSTYESPAQWGDFGFTKGAGNTVGELETNNGANYAIIDAGYTTAPESLLGTIKPNEDIITNWNEGDAAPHWSKIDEAPADMDGDGGKIIETGNGVDDKWNFDTIVIPAGSFISRMHIYIRMRIGDNSQTTTVYITTSLAGVGDYYDDGITLWTWQDQAFSGLSFSQADLDSFWMNVEPYWVGGLQGYIGIEAVYVEVYTTQEAYSVDYIATWNLPEFVLEEDFYYDYRTTFAIDTDLDIYNWDTTVWLELESNTGVGWYTGSYALTDPYIDDGTDRVRIRFQSDLTTTDFDMELDQIVVKYIDHYLISKKHNNSISGYVYMQTNITETIGLGSSEYLIPTTLNEGDYFIVDLQTTSDNALLKLYDDSVL
ncbi:hypothetical protein LCGC14_2315760, partial [marine sediment metagenome]